MFQCFKVLASLSREDNILEKMDGHYKLLAEKLQETEQLLKQAETQNQSVKEMTAELEKRMSKDIAAIEKIKVEFGKCEKMIQDKFLEIKRNAEQYTADIDARVQSYESRIPAVSEKLKELRDTVAEFQK